MQNKFHKYKGSLTDTFSIVIKGKQKIYYNFKTLKILF